jgi:hypothetical protein
MTEHHGSINRQLKKDVECCRVLLTVDTYLGFVYAGTSFVTSYNRWSKSSTTPPNCVSATNKLRCVIPESASCLFCINDAWAAKIKLLKSLLRQVTVHLLYSVLPTPVSLVNHFIACHYGSYTTMDRSWKYGKGMSRLYSSRRDLKDKTDEYRA